MLLTVPLDPAMKPKIRAFSGRVTLFAVLNISCAAYICSLCSDRRKNYLTWTLHTVVNLEFLYIKGIVNKDLEEKKSGRNEDDV